MFAYEQCLLCLGHHPDIWVEAAAYLEHSSKLLTDKGVRIRNFLYIINYYSIYSQAANSGKLFADEAAAMYERAITATLKCNMLIYFAYSDFEEVRSISHQIRFIFPNPPFRAA